MSRIFKVSLLSCAVLCAASFSTLKAQLPLDFDLAGKAEFTAEPGVLYQPMASTDLLNWSPLGGWVWGEGQTHEVIAPLPASSSFYRVDSNAVVDLDSQLEVLRTQQQLPALAVVVIQNGRVSAAGATGTRRFGIDAPVTLQDEWHHGSLTKSMTATLAALLVEEGLIDWTTTLGEVFPGKVSSMAAGWSGVTLKHLLSNSGGAPGDLNTDGIWTTLWNFNGTPEQGRLLLLDEVTTRPLRFSPGAGYEYSNAGFSLAGLMLETLAGKPWEALMEERLFSLLGMKSGGFGVPATPRHIDHPIGHSGNASNPQIWDPGTSADNPPAIGPSATVHATIIDFARYVQAHLRGARGDGDSPLTQSSWDTLHSRAYGYDYALGWNVLNRSWAGGDALHHTGSNTQWFTNVWIAPEVNWACIVCTNFGGNNVFSKVDQVVSWAVNNHGP